jgi:hypothetical protein
VKVLRKMSILHFRISVTFEFGRRSERVKVKSFIMNLHSGQ